MKTFGGGDYGDTDSVLGRRVRKSDSLCAALGDLDELNAAIGLILAAKNGGEEIGGQLAGIQQLLFVVGALLESEDRTAAEQLDAETARMERQAADWESALPPLREFVLPGKTVVSASAHFARTVCRRAERSVVAWFDTVGRQKAPVLRFMNRLSTFLFTLARIAENIE